MRHRQTSSGQHRTAGVSRATVVNARKELAKQARRKPREASTPEPRQRAQHFLREQLARGPKPASFVEEAAEKAQVDARALELARSDLGVVTSRGNAAGGVQAVQWSLPG